MDNTKTSEVIDFSRGVDCVLRSFSMSLDDDEVAASVGMTRHQLKALVRYNSPKWRTVVKLAKEWNVRPVDLLCSTDPDEVHPFVGVPDVWENVQRIAEDNDIDIQVVAARQGTTPFGLEGRFGGDFQVRLLPRLVETLGCSLEEVLNAEV